jgi:hypothetical protein
MRSKLIPTLVAALLASTTYAAAQVSGAPSNEKDLTGQPTDSSQTSAQPQRPAGTQPPMGSRPMDSGPMPGGTAGQGGPVTRDDTPPQPGGIPPSVPPQSHDAGGGGSAMPNPR